MSLAAITTEAVLESFGLEPEVVEHHASGFGNDVYLTAHYAVRIAKNATQDHDRECRIAERMVAAGVRTARPIAWAQGYSVLERVYGEKIGRGNTANDAIWNDLLDDLERVWANPAEPQPALHDWRSGRDAMAVSGLEQHFSDAELEALQVVFDRAWPVNHPAFVHGDAFAENIIVQDQTYRALIDWGCAGWQPLEYEFSRLSDRALALALERHRSHLDLGLLYALRLDISLAVAELGYMPWNVVREALRLALEHGA